MAIVIDKLCDLCRQFSDDFIKFDFSPQETYPDGWLKAPHRGLLPSWGDGFRHVDSYSALVTSAETCALCAVLEREFRKLASCTEGWLGLYPWAYIGKFDRPNKVRAGFSESLAAMPGSPQWGRDPPATFNVCRRRPLEASGEAGGISQTRFYRDVPASGLSEEVWHVARSWLKNCQENHKGCAGGGDVSTAAPTRLIDIGDAEKGIPKLVHSSGMHVPFAALSHCWGGDIPNKTVISNLEERITALDIQELPQNFQDAMRITRELGLRYIWIDALCIIQDSPEDWNAEAARMASIYAGCTVMISAIDSNASTAGILRSSRASRALVTSEYAVQKRLEQLPDVLEASPLNSRAWGMQERLLSRAILHYGSEQLFWECRTAYASECGEYSTSGGYNRVTGDFIDLRKILGTAPTEDWRLWYQLAEEYSSRSLTFAKDKFPALAGAVEKFRESKGPGTYFAGVWVDDIRRAIMWGAHYHQFQGRRVWGYQGPDKCSEFQKPSDRRAPSWSWASVDGFVHFFGFRGGSGDFFELLGVDLTAGRDDAMTEKAEGTLRMRGPLLQMFYRLPQMGDDVGNLTFGHDDSLQDKTRAVGGCVLDFNRKQRRKCWAFVALTTSTARYLLILEKIDGNCFRRIGFCTSYQNSWDLSQFPVQDIALV